MRPTNSHEPPGRTGRLACLSVGQAVSPAHPGFKGPPSFRSAFRYFGHVSEGV